MSEAGFGASNGWVLKNSGKYYLAIRLYPPRGAVTLASTQSVDG